jgi:CO/xanthine dehydrogenase Mo-binding subunit
MAAQRVQRPHRLPGVTVVADGDFIAVVAPTPDAAAGTAIEAIHAEWDPGDTVSESDLWSHLRAHPTEAEGWPGPYAKDLGDFDQAIASAQVRVNHTYTTSYIAHAPLETRVAEAEWEGERLTVWTGTQQPFNVRHALAEALDETSSRGVVP